VGKRRTAAELDVYAGKFRSFEWYQQASGEMPALDAYEDLGDEEKAAFLAALEHWGNLPPGQRPLESRIAQEHDNPLILSIKAKLHRFPTFHAGNNVWVITNHYKKKGQSLGVAGGRVVKRAMKLRDDYVTRIAEEVYYER
jgi:hypothetical protein